LVRFFRRLIGGGRCEINAQIWRAGQRVLHELGEIFGEILVEMLSFRGTIPKKD
jgi:hypothetical protein